MSELVRKMFHNNDFIIKHYDEANVLNDISFQRTGYHDLRIITDKILFSLVHFRPEEIRWIPNPSYKLMKLAVVRNANCIQWVRQSKKLCQIALDKDADTIRYIRRPTPAQLEFVANKHPHSLRYIKKPKVELILKAIEIGGKSILSNIHLDHLDREQLMRIKLAVI